MHTRPLPNGDDDNDVVDPENDPGFRGGRGQPMAIASPKPNTTGRWLWHPRAVPVPRLAPDFPELTGFQRGVEAIFFALARVECWLSPGGGLRAWLRLNLILGLALCASAVLVLPASGHVIAELVTWTGMADTMASHMSGAVLRLPPALVVIGSVALGLAIWRHLHLRRMARRDPRERDPRYGFDDYR